MIAGLVDRLIGGRVLLADRISYSRPEELGLAAEALTVRRAGASPLAALRIPGPPGAPRVLFCPGNSANLSGHLAYLELLARAGLEVLGFDYRGFGRSEGRPSLRGLLDDADAALEALLSVPGDADGPGAAAGKRAPVGVFGVSLGANVALELAARRREVGAVAVEGLSIQREAVRGILREGVMGPRTVRRVSEGDGAAVDRPRHALLGSGNGSRGGQGGPPRSLRPLLAPLWSAIPWLAERFNPFAGKDPCRAAARIAGCPVFLIHGADDRLLPFEAALQVHRALAGPRRLWLIPGAGHAQEPALTCDGEYVSQLSSFFRAALGGEGLRGPALLLETASAEGGGRVDLEVRGDAGPYLVALVAGPQLHFLRLWAEEGAGPDGSAAARASVELPAPVEEAHAIRYHQAVRRGNSWEPTPGERARCFERVGGRLRALSSALIEGRLGEADRVLADLEKEELPMAFELARRLHRARRGRLARRAKTGP